MCNISASPEQAVRTAFLYNETFLLHDTGAEHPEVSERLTAIKKRIESRDLHRRLVPVDIAMPDIAYIELIHDPDYIRRVRAEVESGAGYFDSTDNAVSPRSFEVAVLAVGGCLKVCDAVMTGEADNGFCAVRPPGHHAKYKKAGGFCFFNNIAIAARYLQHRYGIQKVAIVDWDVHHGDGTQDCFDSDDTVYYISLHQYPFYPGTGSEMETGFGKGMGYTMNIPMRAGSGNYHYLRAFREKILPELRKYRPEIILVSAGFDAHRDDPLASINLTSNIYYTLTKMLKEIAHGSSSDRIIAFLEGGYNVEACAEGVEKVLEALLEDET